MAKRFTDTTKWKKEFIKGLSAKMKLLWFYILDDCDHAGIWEVDMEVASLRIGELITYEEAVIALGQQITPINKNKWFIRDFIFFQYGELKPTNRMHQSVIAILNKHNIPLTSPLQGAKDMVKDKEQDKDKEQGGLGGEVPRGTIDFTQPDVDGDERVFPVDNKPIRELWAKWKEYRYQEFGMRYPMMGEQADLKRLEGLSPPDIERTILTAMANKWKNLHPEYNRNGHASTSTAKSKHQQHVDSLIAGFAARHGTATDPG